MCVTPRPIEKTTSARLTEASQTPNKDSSFCKDDHEQSLTTVEQFRARAPYCNLEQVILPQITSKGIDTLLSRIRNHRLLYETWELSKIDPAGRNKIISFYGLPGTGKTMCAEALAAKLGKSIIEVNYAEIESKYVGETGKNIRLAFQSAAEQDAVLFFDEADSILGKRMTDIRQAADQAVNVSRAVMLKELDQFTGVVIFATNLAKNFDGAFVRRILMHIEVPAPDLEGRIKLWEYMVSKKVPGRDQLNWKELAEKSDGLTGGEIKNAVIICLSEFAACFSEGQKVQQQDVLLVVENVLKAKQEIAGEPFYSSLKANSADLGDKTPTAS